MSKKVPILGLLVSLGVLISAESWGFVHAQSRSQAKLTIKVTVNGRDRSSHVIENLGLLIQRKTGEPPDTIVSSVRVSTTSLGSVSVVLLPGDYIVKSEEPVIFAGEHYEWSVNCRVEIGIRTSLELNNDNATITPADVALKEGRITADTDLLAVLRDGVVSVQGEVQQGTGFIAEASGLILTTQHLISNSTEVRIQFDRGRKVAAKVLVEDPEKDLAVLQANLTACSSCKPLTLAETEHGLNMPAIAGTRAFAIISAVDGEKTLTRTTVNKAGSKPINIDMTIDVTNSGAPLFNGKGEVLGLLRFVDQPITPDTSRKVVAENKVQTSGVIAIEEATDLLAKARQSATDANALPSAELLPTEPDDFFPTGSLKNLVDVKSFKQQPYETEVGKYQLTLITPAVKYYMTERDRTQFARQQAKEAKKNKNVAPDKPPAASYSFRNLRSWADYVSQMKPVVHLLAIPEVKATGKSIALGALTAGILAAGGTPSFPSLDYKFKANFKEMLLSCDGKPVIPIQRGKIEFVAQMQSYYRSQSRFAYAGLYTYPIDTFDPQKCKQLSLQVVSEEQAIPPGSKLIDPRMVQKVWSDFAPYRQQSTGSKAANP